MVDQFFAPAADPRVWEVSKQRPPNGERVAGDPDLVRALRRSGAQAGSRVRLPDDACGSHRLHADHYVYADGLYYTPASTTDGPPRPNARLRQIMRLGTNTVSARSANYLDAIQSMYGFVATTQVMTCVAFATLWAFQSMTSCNFGIGGTRQTVKFFLNLLVAILSVKVYLYDVRLLPYRPAAATRATMHVHLVLLTLRWGWECHWQFRDLRRRLRQTRAIGDAFRSPIRTFERAFEKRVLAMFDVKGADAPTVAAVRKAVRDFDVKRQLYQERTASVFRRDLKAALEGALPNDASRADLRAAVDEAVDSVAEMLNLQTPSTTKALLRGGLRKLRRPLRKKDEDQDEDESEDEGEDLDRPRSDQGRQEDGAVEPPPVATRLAWTDAVGEGGDAFRVHSGLLRLTDTALCMFTLLTVTMVVASLTICVYPMHVAWSTYYTDVRGHRIKHAALFMGTTVAAVSSGLAT